MNYDMCVELVVNRLRIYDCVLVSARYKFDCRDISTRVNWCTTVVCQEFIISYLLYSTPWIQGTSGNASGSVDMCTLNSATFCTIKATLFDNLKSMRLLLMYLPSPI